VAYDAHEVEVQRENPFLSQTEMFRVMTRSMDLYRRRHAGRSPHRVMVHKTTEFKSEETNGCMVALHLCEAVDLVQIVEDIGWCGIRIDNDTRTKKGKPASFPVARGSLIGLSPRESLLWLHGDVHGISNRGACLQGAHPARCAWCVTLAMGHGMTLLALFMRFRKWTGITMPYMTNCL